MTRLRNGRRPYTGWLGLRSGIGTPVALWLVLAAIVAVGAEEPRAPDAEPKAPAATAAAAELSHEQQQIAEKYRRFEEVLVRMAELTAPTDPKRAALLRKAVAESKHQLIGMQLDKLSELLGQDRLSVALTNQSDVNKDLSELLSLLLTEEREKGLKDERARIKEQIRRVTELINKERQLQGQTAEGGEMQGLAKGQSKIAEDAGKLAEDMKRPDAAGDKEKEGKDDSRDAKESPGDKGEQGKDGQSGENEAQGKDGQDKDGGGKPQQGESKEGEKSADGEKPNDKDAIDKDQSDKDAKDGKKDQAGDESKKDASEEKRDGEATPPSKGDNKDQSKDGKKGSSKQGQGQGQGESQEDQDDQQKQEQNPPQDSSESARKRVAAAQEKMDSARQKLEKAQRQGAVEEEEAAIRELEQAKAELEEILRQLREEELERMLAMLEARFRKMLQAQLEVYEGTKRVDHKPQAERDRNDEIEAGRLSRKESQISLEAEAALHILREEGSAVAFPEAVEQMREDIDQIVRRLGQSDVGDITQGIEEDVIAALEEMIEALKKAQQDMEKQKQQQAPPQEGQPEDPPLIDTLAELKMIRSLQMRINMRTKRLARMVEGEVGQADKPELLDQLQRLAEREESVFRVTRDIVTGKNR